MHDTKIGVIVRTDLEAWQKLNVTAFLSSGLAAKFPECIGEHYVDNSGGTYLPIFKQPVFVYMASTEELKRTRSRAVNRNIPFALYIKEMFETGNDIDNRASVQAVSTEDLDIVGIALRCDKKSFDKIVNGLKFHS